MSRNILHKKAQELLGPFFSVEMVKWQLGSFLVLWLTLGILWPKKLLAYYVQSGTAPLTFLVVFVLALIIYSYLNLIYGDGEVLQLGRHPWVGHNKIYPSIAQTVHDIPYFIIGSFIQNLLLWIPVLPVLLISAGISGLSIHDTFKAFSILYMTSLVCSIFGALVYQFFRDRHYIIFIITRLFLAFTLVATGFLDAYANPILLIYGMNKGEEMLLAPFLNAYKFYITVTFLTTGILILGEYFVVWYQNKRTATVNSNQSSM